MKNALPELGVELQNFMSVIITRAKQLVAFTHFRLKNSFSFYILLKIFIETIHLKMKSFNLDMYQFQQARFLMDRILSLHIYIALMLLFYYYYYQHRFSGR